MEAYRYQELVYLVVPVMVGMEFFMTARAERRGFDNPPVGTYVLDFFGFLFAAIIPAIFIFTIWSIETGAFSFGNDTLARFDRYAVMFFFMGAWWQVYLLTALRVRRSRDLDVSDWYVWVPYLGLGIFISLLVLWVSPWGLKWVSVIWFFFLFGALKLSGVTPKVIEKVFWVLTLITFFGENLLFLWLETLL
ncbi:MAG: hypothetical protein JSV21_00405 [Nitrospirota bacterium]|nr:MAG: hypothetical protein JSV21_00405 [Nitrospirota bacterium]